MKSVVRLLLVATLAPTLASAAATLSGTEFELRQLLAPEPETVNLAASATATLVPKSAVIRGAIEVEARTYGELLRLTAEKEDAINAALADFAPVFADTYLDPDNAIEIAKLKRLALRTNFRVPLPDLAAGDKVIGALGAIASVAITDVELTFQSEPDLGGKLLNAAVEDLARQKAFYEQTFGVELKLRSFIPFTAPERGGGDQSPAEEEMIVLSPFEVAATRRNWQFRRKARAEDIVVEKIFTSRQVVKQISAVYEIHAK